MKKTLDLQNRQELLNKYKEVHGRVRSWVLGQRNLLKFNENNEVCIDFAALQAITEVNQSKLRALVQFGVINSLAPEGYKLLFTIDDLIRVILILAEDAINEPCNFLRSYYGKNFFIRDEDQIDLIKNWLGEHNIEYISESP